MVASMRDYNFTNLGQSIDWDLLHLRAELSQTELSSINKVVIPDFGPKLLSWTLPSLKSMVATLH